MNIEINLDASTDDNLERFGKFVLLRPIRKGGMSLLHLAYDTAGGRVVVLKRTRMNAKDRGSDFVARFRDEVATSFQLHHPNLVHAVEAGEIGDELFLSLEWIQGQDLGALRERCGRLDTQLPIAVAGSIVLSVLGGLEAAHKVGGFVHRDVKPDNIMLGYDGSVKVLDYGLSLTAFKSAKTIPGMTVGTVGSMSPEQKAGKPVDARSDLFSLGTVLFFLLTGVSVDAAEDGNSKEHLRARLCRPDVPESVVTFLWRSLQANPNNRFESATEMASSLRAALPATADADAKTLSAFIGTLFDAEKRSDDANLIEWHQRYGGPQRRLQTAVLQLPAAPLPPSPATAAPKQVAVPAESAPLAIPHNAWPKRIAIALAIVFLSLCAWFVAKKLTGSPAIPVDVPSPHRPPPEVAPAPVPAPPAEVVPPEVVPETPPQPAIAPRIELPKTSPSLAPSSRIAEANRLANSGQSAGARRLLAEYPSDPATRMALAKIEFEAGNYSDAIKAASSAAKLGAGTKAYAARANAELASGRNAEAARDFRHVLAATPNDTDAQQGLKRAERLLGSSPP